MSSYQKTLQSNSIVNKSDKPDMRMIFRVNNVNSFGGERQIFYKDPSQDQSNINQHRNSSNTIVDTYRNLLNSNVYDESRVAKGNNQFHERNQSLHNLQSSQNGYIDSMHTDRPSFPVDHDVNQYQSKDKIFSKLYQMSSLRDDLNEKQSSTQIKKQKSDLFNVPPSALSQRSKGIVNEPINPIRAFNNHRDEREVVKSIIKNSQDANSSKRGMNQSRSGVHFNNAKSEPQLINKVGNTRYLDYNQEELPRRNDSMNINNDPNFLQNQQQPDNYWDKINLTIQQKDSQSPMKSSTIQSHSICWSDQIDSNFLENMEPEDVLQYLPEEILRDPKFNLDKALQDNIGYILHLMGQCACTRCSCGLCKCDDSQSTFKLSKGMSSVYGKDFGAKSDSMPSIQLDHSLKDSSLGSSNFVDFTSVHQRDYVQHQANPAQNTNRPDWKPSQNNFMGTSTYKNNFINWQYPESGAQIQPQNSTTVVPGMPFFGRTTYGDSFLKQNPKDNGDGKSIADKMRNSNNPITSGFPFLGETESMKNFKSFQTIPHHQVDASETYEQIPSFQGQFNSTHSQEFTKGVDRKCQVAISQKVWRQKLFEQIQDWRKNKYYDKKTGYN